MRVVLHPSRPVGPSIIAAMIQDLRGHLHRRRRAAAEHAEFCRIRDEIARMPQDMALDLGICRGDAEELADRALSNRR